MNKKNLTIIIIAAAVVVVIGVLVGRGNNNMAQAPTATSTTPTIGTSSTTGGVTISISPVSGSGTPSTKSYQDDSFSLRFPAAWNIIATSPFSISNVDGSWHGTNIPIGGTEMDVVTTTLYSDVKGIMSVDLAAAVNLSSSTITVDGVSCAKAVYEGSFGAAGMSRNNAVYCAHGTGLWKIYLMYNASDTNGSVFLADFANILASMKFLP